MKGQGLSDKERALIEGARREAMVKRAAVGKPRGAAQRAAVRPAQGPRTVIGWDHAAAQTTPLDAPTVAGWDHPAAQPAAGDADKWSRIAALMEQERAEGRARRRRAQRGVAVFLLILFVLVAFAGARILAR